VSAAGRLAVALGAARRILVFTGAGISTASGIPDYRGPSGVWKTRRPVVYDEFLHDPEARERYWRQKAEDWEAWGRHAEPNAVHRAIVALEAAGRIEMVVTQNVDGLHRAAGTDPSRLVEIHGTNALVECQRCGRRDEASRHYEAILGGGQAPVCDCGGLLKPATISFGQALREEDLARAVGAARRCDLALALGSTLTVTPAADIPLEAHRRGAPYVIVNRGATAHDGLPGVTRIDGDVVEILPPAVRAVLEGDGWPYSGEGAPH